MPRNAKSKLEKNAKPVRFEDQISAADDPAWYQTWWGVISAAVFCFILLISLMWVVLGKPHWVKIELSNCFVALVSVGLTYLFLRVLSIRSRAVKILCGVIWLLFIPNTAYLFTDLGHLIPQWNEAVSPSDRGLLIVQYLVLEGFAVIAFLYSFHPFEKIIERVAVFSKRRNAWLILFNFLVAFGMVLGRFEHINSHLVFTNPLKVLESVIQIFGSFDLLGLTILFGLICNVIYFFFRGWLLQRINRKAVPWTVGSGARHVDQ